MVSVGDPQGEIVKKELNRMKNINKNDASVMISSYLWKKNPKKHDVMTDQGNSLAFAIKTQAQPQCLNSHELNI